MVPEPEDVEDDAEIQLDAGMPVESEEGEPLGKLASVLVDEETEEPGFLTVDAGGIERLVPVEAVLDVQDGTLILECVAEDFARLPKATSETGPTEAEIEMAYKVLGLSEEEED